MRKRSKREVYAINGSRPQNIYVIWVRFALAMTKGHRVRALTQAKHFLPGLCAVHCQGFNAKAIQIPDRNISGICRRQQSLFFRMQINVFIVSLDPEQFALRIIHSTHPCFVELPDLSKVMALLPQPKRHNREGGGSKVQSVS